MKSYIHLAIAGLLISGSIGATGPDTPKPEAPISTTTKAGMFTRIAKLRGPKKALIALSLVGTAGVTYRYAPPIFDLEKFIKELKETP